MPQKMFDVSTFAMIAAPAPPRDSGRPPPLSAYPSPDTRDGAG
ncbi:MAG TPA: hypothetical protein VHM90_11530 [Phycisphaerae bacterium]|nr:hypothetical protein [Phycisphaerae bacterium]